MYNRYSEETHSCTANPCNPKDIHRSILYVHVHVPPPARFIIAKSFFAPLIEGLNSQVLQLEINIIKVHLIYGSESC